MSFRKIAKTAPPPPSPDKLLLDLPRRKIPGVLAHQAEVMRSYAATASDEPDVALQLPTGSGKTLVGTLIAEWTRRRLGDRVLYVVPTKQLVHQVVEQCENKYGIQANGFVGSAGNYSPSAKSEYKTAEKIAVTNYSSIFNTNPYFSDAQTLIIDDAHASENYVSKLWTVEISRGDPDHRALFSTLIGVIRNLVHPSIAYKLESPPELNAGWIDKLPTPALYEALTDIQTIIDHHATEIRNIRYPWSLIRDRLLGCHLYFNESEITIRPLIPPTWTHSAFTSPRQRIYMSATLGAGGDLERQFGRSKIVRVPIPEQWDTHGVGRRLFLFPGMGLDEAESTALRLDMVKAAGRSLILVPSKSLGDKVTDLVREKTGFRVVHADDIEESKQPFVGQTRAVAVIANRYDGIDFPGDDCRLMFVDGLPKATNAQERFLMSRMGANVLFNERVQTRVLQAIGRCTRSLEDYSAVVVMGDDLQDYLIDRTRRRYLHPDIQAELQFGIEQSKGATRSNFIDYLKTFLANDEDWENANQGIIDLRAGFQREQFPAIDELESIVAFEIEYQKKLWQGDYLHAVEAAGSILGKLGGADLRGYRALWNYLAGSAAWLAHKQGALPDAGKAEAYFFDAKNAAIGLPWLVALATPQRAAKDTEDADLAIVMAQIENIEQNLEKLGKSHDRRFVQREKEILNGLQSPESFERAHVLLGEFMGYESNKLEVDASPDPWWSLKDLCIVFEDHAGALPGNSLSVEKARQAADHPRWIRSNVPSLKDAQIIAALVSPIRTSSIGAKPHLAEVGFWPIEDFREWAQKAVATIRDIRKTFSEPGDLVWRADAARELRSAGFDFPSLFRKIEARRTDEHIQFD